MTLIIEKSYINGEWASGDPTIDVTNPTTGEVIGTIPDLSNAQVERAIQAAHDAFPAWAAKTAYDRAIILRKWCDLIVQHKEVLARIITLESGKPLREGLTEANTNNIEWSLEEAKRIYGRTIPSNRDGRDMMTIKQPVGVCGLITPWNFPMAMVTRKAGPALAVGCTVVLKPDHQTPFTALALAKLAAQAGVPSGVFNVVTGDAPRIGKILSTHPLVRKISFTGSTRVGKILMEQASGTMKKLSLELGGNAPFIMFDSADMDVAVASMMEAKMRNTGQTCICPNRVYVQDTIHDAFVERLVTAIKTLKPGNGMDEGVTLGPLINEAGVQKVETLVQRAIDHGAKLIAGGKRHALGGTFYEPTILTDVDPKMSISCEEIFGPVIAIQKFSNEEDVLRLANDSEHGLAGYIMTNDLNQMRRVTQALEVGMVGVNTGLISVACAPFGGVKQSGIGLEGGSEGLDEYLHTKHIAVQG